MTNSPALTLAISRNLSLRVERKRNTYYLIIPEDKRDDSAYSILKTAVHGLSGIVPNTRVKWTEAVRIKLEYKLDRLWLLLLPAIWQDRPEDATVEEVDIADEFVRERYATRYNNKYNDIIEAWIAIIVGNADTKALAAFGIQDGIDANFIISRITAFSWKEK
ncbi:MAG: hypothetical protein Q7U68_07095 [Candidatus Roizmanbacteria bacterium]|nr:hypothetical protein [Candidatus Roizmanbacteria bacterium]